MVCVKSWYHDGSLKIWRPVINGVPQGSVLDLIMFNIFINDLDGVAECALSTFAPDTRLEGVADIPENCAAIQTNLNRLWK